MALTSPLLFLVGGAWHQPANYQALTDQLKNLDLDLHVGLSRSHIRSIDQPHDVTVQDDTDAIRTQLIGQLDAHPNRDIIVLAHSYGGMPGGAAPRGLSKIERSRAGKANGIIGLIWLTAFIVDEGDSLFSGAHASDLSPEEQGVTGFIQSDTPRNGLLWVSDPAPIFYNDCDEATVAEMKKHLVPQAASSFGSPAGRPAWRDEAFAGKLAYVRHTLDAVIPVAFQDRLMKCSGQEWIVRDIETAHSAFAKKPAELAGIVKKLMELFAA